MPKTLKYVIRNENGDVVDSAVTDFEPGRQPSKPPVPLQRELLQLCQELSEMEEDELYAMPVSFWRRFSNQAEMERQQAKKAKEEIWSILENMREQIKEDARAQGNFVWVCWRCGNIGPSVKNTGAITPETPEGWDTFECGCPKCKNREYQKTFEGFTVFGKVDNDTSKD